MIEIKRPQFKISPNFKSQRSHLQIANFVHLTVQSPNIFDLQIHNSGGKKQQFHTFEKLELTNV